MSGTLRIDSFDEKNLGSLNKWAKDVDNKHKQHETDISNLKVFIQNLFDKNPNLNRP